MNQKPKIANILTDEREREQSPPSFVRQECQLFTHLSVCVRLCARTQQPNNSMLKILLLFKHKQHTKHRFIIESFIMKDNDNDDYYYIAAVLCDKPYERWHAEPEE